MLVMAFSYFSEQIAVPREERTTANQATTSIRPVPCPSP
jgi:hypothetical protein